MKMCTSMCFSTSWFSWLTFYVPVFQGNCAENTASKYKISRQAQDEYAIRSYKLSQAAAQEGVFQKEITPVEIPQKKGTVITLVEMPLARKQVL